MKNLKLGTALSAVILLTGTASAALGLPLTSQNFPTTVQGRSGGNQSTGNCGTIAQAPNVEINLSQPTYLKLSAQVGGDPTLYIQGPLNLCVLDDKMSANGLETSGRWPAGVYQIYVGDRQGGSHPFNLAIEGSSN